MSYEKFSLWRIRKCQSSGYSEDGSRETTCENKIRLVPEDEVDIFLDVMASEAGYQDYNYKINYKELARNIEPAELTNLKEQITKEVL